MARSLLRQLEQIRRAATYDDAVASVNTSSVAEPTVSGSLEEDVNVVRTILLQLKGGTNWYDDPGKYFDPTDTDVGDADNKQMDLANIKGKTLDSHTVIIAVSDDNSGAGFTVSGTSTGILASITTDYAIPTDREGLPIFNSVTNSGSYHDEAGSDNVCRVDVLDMNNDQEFDDGTHTIYAKMHDGADNSGTGTGTDVYFRFYKNGAVCTLASTGVTGVKFVYPQRKVMSNMNEYDWTRTDFISSWEGDVELVEDISNLWSFTGATDGDSDAGDFTNETGNYPLASGPSDLKSAIDLLNDEIDDMTFTEDNYIVDGDTVADALDKLDIQVKNNADDITASDVDKYVESITVAFDANTSHLLPSSATYTACSDAGREGKNMDVYVDGQLVSADTGSAGANADRDYAETDSTHVTFRFNIQVGRNITYMIRQ